MVLYKAMSSILKRSEGMLLNNIELDFKTKCIEERFERPGIAADRVKYDPETICGFCDLK